MTTKESLINEFENWYDKRFRSLKEDFVSANVSEIFLAGAKAGMEMAAKTALQSKHIATPETITDRIRHWNDACRWNAEAIRQLGKELE